MARPNGHAMTVDDWHDTSHHAFGVLLSPSLRRQRWLLFNAAGGAGVRAAFRQLQHASHRN